MINEYLLNHYDELNFSLFIAAYSIVAILEAIAPRRALSQPAGRRWSANLTLGAINLVLLPLVYPMLTVTLALFARDNGLGLFNNLTLPDGLALFITLVLLDVRGWLVHYLLHYIPVLWRVHRLHHSDPDYDFSTGLRFHPLEALLTVGVDSALILALGAPPLAVALYRLVYVIVSAFAHANLRLPDGLERRLRRLIVTPDLHRVHHSADEPETNSNFGAVSPLWDRLLGTYADQPALGHANMEVGLRGLQDANSIRLRHMLLLPLRPPDEAGYTLKPAPGSSNF